MTERTPLSRERVAAAALAFIDEHGMAALSMRKLGAVLGVEAMSLYNHVGNKDDLLDAVADLLYGEILAAYVPDPRSSWQQDARELAAVFRTVAYAHENAFTLISDRVVPSSVKVAFLERVFRVFTKAGFPVKDAALAFDTISGWAIGTIRADMGIMRTLAERGPGIDRGAVPDEKQAVVDFADACVAWTSEQRFAYGLDTLIAGFEARLARLD